MKIIRIPLFFSKHTITYAISLSKARMVKLLLTYSAVMRIYKFFWGNSLVRGKDNTKSKLIRIMLFILYTFVNCERICRKNMLIQQKIRMNFYFFSFTIRNWAWRTIKSLLFDLTPHLWYAFLCTFKQLSNVWKIYDTVIVFLNLSATSCYATLNKLVHIHTHLYFHRQRIRQGFNSVLFFLVRNLTIKLTIKRSGDDTPNFISVVDIIRA